jgi:diguanylate cyclase (GGDEF)-like protein
VYRIIQCLTQEHNYLLLAVASCVCIAGSLLSVHILRRVINVAGIRKHVQLVLGSLVAGTTIWSTHFIAMLAYDPGVDHGFDPFLTMVSLGLAVLGTLITNVGFVYGNRKNSFLIAGISFGLTVSVMHYVGMHAYLLPGEIVWHHNVTVQSVLLGIGIGIAAYHRVLYPVTQYCWLGGAILMVLSITTMHFTGMAAFEIRLNSAIIVPPQLLSDELLSIIVFSVVTLLLFVGFAALSIETNLEKEAFKQLQYTVAHDHLTGLPNRQSLKQHLSDLTALMWDDPTIDVAVFSINLVQFKTVNDLHGQNVGDQVLLEVTRRLKNGIGANAFLSRVGGDEFVVIKGKCDGLTSAKAYAQHLLDQITPTIHLGADTQTTCTIAISAALGIATSMHDGTELENLLQKADLAMFCAKQEPDVKIYQYDAEMDRKLREKTQLIAYLREALAQEQFEVVYQLQNDSASRDAVGCEALLRWHHPDLGTVSPVVFIPLAEETGLINDIGRWVLKTACQEAASWDKPWSIAVNVAPQQLAQPTFIDDLLVILQQTGLAPQRLELEVTEASVINDQAYTLRVLKQVKDLGVGIAMDDFGTGYSSLATLQTFPFDKIKIDRSFVTNLHNDHRRAAIVRSTLSLGEAFDIPVLAEGVETEEELCHLAAEGCCYVQGFYFGKPLSVDVLRKYMAGDTISLAS